MPLPRRVLVPRAVLFACGMLVAACSVNSIDSGLELPGTVTAGPTSAPTPTPPPGPRLDPNGVPVPDPGPPTRPDVADPAAVIAGIVAVEVGMVPFVEPQPTPAPGPDAPPLRIAGVVTASIGPLRVADNLCDGARARFERANRDFELRRPIVLVDCLDDNGDPERNRTLVDELTADGRIFAIAPATSVALFADDLLNERHVPYVGVGDLPAYCGFETGFGFAQTGASGCPALAAATTPLVAVPYLELYATTTGADLDGLKVAVVRADDIAGELFGASVAFEAESTGAELVLDVADAPTPSDPERTDWTAVVKAIEETDPDLVIIDGERTDGLYGALQDSYEGDVMGNGYLDPGTLAADVDLLTAVAGSYQVSQGYDITASGDGADQFRFDLNAIGIDDDAIDASTLSGYVAADFLVSAVAVVPDPITSEALHNIVNNGWQYRGIDRLVCPGWWPVSHVVPYPCAAVAEVVPLGAPLVNRVPLTSFDLRVRTPGGDPED